MCQEYLGMIWMIFCSSEYNYKWSCVNEIGSNFPANIYLFKVNNKNTRKKCEKFSKLTIKTPERRQRRRSGVFIVSFENISHLFLVFPLLTLNK